MVASGISLYRVAAPVLIAGMALSVLTLPVQELLIPRVADKLLRTKSTVRYDRVQSKAVYFTPDDRGNLLTAARFEVRGDADNTTATLEGVRVLQRDEAGGLQRRIAADTAVWVPQNQAWRFVPEGRATKPELSANNFSGDAAMPEPVSELQTELSPDVLLARQATIYVRLLSLARLRDLQNNPAVEPAMRAEITRTIWGRLSLQGMNLLVLVMGLPFFLAVGSANLLMQSLKAAAVCISAWGGGLIMLQAGAGLLPPVLAAWLPVVLYLPASAFLLSLVRT